MATKVWRLAKSDLCCSSLLRFLHATGCITNSFGMGSPNSSTLNNFKITTMKYRVQRLCASRILKVSLVWLPILLHPRDGHNYSCRASLSLRHSGKDHRKWVWLYRVCLVTRTVFNTGKVNAAVNDVTFTDLAT